MCHVWIMRGKVATDMKLSKTRTCGDASYIIGKESFLFFINWYTIEKVMSRFVRTWTFFVLKRDTHKSVFIAKRPKNLLVILHQTVTILRWRKSIFFLEKVLIGAQRTKTTL